jgi:hypothetical protein
VQRVRSEREACRSEAPESQAAHVASNNKTHKARLIDRVNVGRGRKLLSFGSVVIKALRKRLAPKPSPAKPRRDARLKVLEMMPKGSVCAEIGVWKGGFSKRILKRVEPTSLHLIDPWEFIEDEGYERAIYGGKEAKNQADMDRIFENVRLRFADEIASGIVHLHRGKSAETGAGFPDDYFDWVYIDGNHLYEFVRDDLVTYHDKVKPGGYIAGDDYGTPGWWRGGVKKAVDEFVASGRAEWVLQEGPQYVLRNL